jgi:NAD-dependent dihydropyrimidine dehydrogenase PreA subunit/flavodoxin
MNKIYCFSGTGHTKEIADYFATALNENIIDIRLNTTDCDDNIDVAIVLFPVYCQDIPVAVKKLLPEIKAKYFVLIATYGKMSYGNVLFEASRIVNGTVIASAYIPTEHTYLKESVKIDFSRLAPILNRINNPQRAYLPKLTKNPLAGFLPKMRSQIAVKISKTNACTECSICSNNCPMNAMENGVTNNQCIRCLRCVQNCPNNALRVRYNFFLKQYLKKKPKNELVVYL